MKPLLDGVWWALSAFIIICALWASNAKAETNIFVGAWSKHLISSSENLNEEHNLFAVEHKKWFAGRFSNSYGRDSYALARKFEWKSKDLRAGFYAGAIRGYTKCYGDDGSNTDVCPLIVPYITYDAATAPQFMLIGEAVAVTIKLEI